VNGRMRGLMPATRRAVAPYARSGRQRVHERELLSLVAEECALRPHSSRFQRRLSTDPETLVAALGPRAGPAELIVKVATAAPASRHLCHEFAALRHLRSLDALAAWRDLIPEPRALVRLESGAAVAFGALPGKEARLLLGSSTQDGLLRTAMTAISGLTGATADLAVVGDDELDRWIREPGAVLRRTTQIDRDVRLRKSFTRLEGELRQAFEGRQVATAWAHGDFWLGNVLVCADTGRITGIIDWERAGPREPAVLDCVNLLLTTAALLRREELGAVVCRLAAGGWRARGEQRLLAGLRSRFGGEAVSLRHLILLAWLRHTAGNLSTRAFYGRRRVWLRRNVLAVLEHVAP
jgi:aminoglycoside phosphotransferase (APT) family kinase protein